MVPPTSSGTIEGERRIGRARIEQQHQPVAQTHGWMHDLVVHRGVDEGVDPPVVHQVQGPRLDPWVPPGVDEQQQESGLPGCILGALGNHGAGEGCRRDLVGDEADHLCAALAQASGQRVGAIAEARSSREHTRACVSAGMLSALALRDQGYRAVTDTPARSATSLSSGRPRAPVMRRSFLSLARSVLNPFTELWSSATAVALLE